MLVILSTLNIQFTIITYMKVVHCWLKGIHFINRKNGTLQIYLFYLSMVIFSVLSYTSEIKSYDYSAYFSGVVVSWLVHLTLD